jgi:endonuclease/exonuclease/phosphatase family metal-dependent hydrolase
MRKQKKRTIRLASYNVHSWFGRDLRCDPERVVEVIRELDAHIIALQEAKTIRDHALTASLEGFCDEEGYEIVEGPTLEDGKSSYGNALLCRFPIRKTSKVDLSVPFREPRGALAADIEHQGVKIQVVATHLGLRARERVRQVSQLLEWLSSEVSRAAPDVLSLMGDVNEWRGKGAALRRIESAFGQIYAPRTFPAARPWLRLDRIWVLPRSAMIGRVHAHRSPLARLASDHLPVLAEVELSGRGSG